MRLAARRKVPNLKLGRARLAGAHGGARDGRGEEGREGGDGGLHGGGGRRCSGCCEGENSGQGTKTRGFGRRGLLACFWPSCLCVFQLPPLCSPPMHPPYIHAAVVSSLFLVTHQRDIHPAASAATMPACPGTAGPRVRSPVGIVPSDLPGPARSLGQQGSQTRLPGPGRLVGQALRWPWFRGRLVTAVH